MHHSRIGFGDDSDFLVGQIGAVREQCVRAQDVQWVVGVCDTATGVSVLGEQNPMPSTQRPCRLRLFLQLGERDCCRVGIIEMLSAQGWRHDANIDSSGIRTVPTLHDSVAGRELLLKAYRQCFCRAAVPAHEAAGKGRPAGSHRQKGSNSDLANRLAVTVGIHWLIGAQNAVATAEQRYAAGDTELQALERG